MKEEGPIKNIRKSSDDGFLMLLLGLGEASFTHSSSY